MVLTVRVKGADVVRVRRTVGVGVLVALLTLGFIPPAMSAHWAGYNAGNWEVWFTQCNLDPTVHYYFHQNDNHDVDDSPEGPATTDIDSRKTDAHNDCSDIDVRIADDAYPLDNREGWWQCNRWVADPDGPAGAVSCDIGRIRINVASARVPEIGPVTEAVVCQEIGHALGLGHSNEIATHPDGNPGTCMEDRPGVTGARSHLTSHDMATIDFYTNPSPLD